MQIVITNNFKKVENSLLQIFDKSIIIHSSYLNDKPKYPIILDILENIQSNYVFSESTLSTFQIIKNSVAPTWEDLIINSKIKYSNERKWLPYMISEISSLDEAPSIQQFLYNSVVDFINKFCPSICLVFNNPHYLDAITIGFINRYIKTNIHNKNSFLCFVAEKKYNSFLYKNFPISDIEILLTSKFYNNKVINSSNILTEKSKLETLCLSPHGLPEKLFLKQTDIQLIKTTIGENIFVSLPNPIYKRILKTIPSITSTSLNSHLFKKYSCNGWMYLRRGIHALNSKKLSIIKKNHTSFIFGLSQIGYEYCIDYFRTIATLSSSKEERKIAYICIARLSFSSILKNGFNKSVQAYKNVLPHCSKPHDFINSFFELANALANHRTPESLKESRLYYNKAFSKLDEIRNKELKAKTEIQLLNGLALVEYHEKNDNEALSLETNAQKIISTNKYQILQTWAKPLVFTNTAKLLLKRYNDPEAAIKMLQEVIKDADLKIQLHTKQGLARVLFDQKRYKEAALLLKERYDENEIIEIDEKEELYDRVLYFLSLVQLKEFSKAVVQHSRIKRIAELNNMNHILEFLENIVNEYSLLKSID